MEAFLLPLVAAAVGFGLSYLPGDPSLKARLRAWLWLTPAAWAVIIGWALAHYDQHQPAPPWVLKTLWFGGLPLVALAALASALLTVRPSTWFYVLPFLAAVCGFAAYSWLLAYMELNHAWF